MLSVRQILAATSSAAATSLADGGETVPPPFTVTRVFTETRLDSWLALGLVVTAALYLYGVYRLTLQREWAHELVHAHFIATGCVFFWPLLGLDPLPGRWPYPARALLMLLSVPFHTVLGLTIMQSTTLFGGDWYPSLHLSWSDPWNDQVVAGGVLWAGGEFVSVTMLAVLVVQWIKQSEREARRLDRALDRQEALQRAAESGPEGYARAGRPARGDARYDQRAATRWEQVSHE